MGSKTTSEASVVQFLPTGGKQLVTALGGVAPIGAFPVEGSFLISVGTTNGLILIWFKTLWIFRRKYSPSLTNCDLNRGVGQKGEFLSS